MTMPPLRSALFALALIGCGELPGFGSGDEPANPDCNVSPASWVTYRSEGEIQALLVGRWQRCKAPQVKGEDVGVEFTADHHWYPLTRRDGVVVRQMGVDYGGEWKYLPPGEKSLLNGQPEPEAQFMLTAITNPPKFTNDPRQMRVLFSPVLSVYVPLR
jgi:hypothetical protein